MISTVQKAQQDGQGKHVRKSRTLLDTTFHIIRKEKVNIMIQSMQHAFRVLQNAQSRGNNMLSKTLSPLKESNSEEAPIINIGRKFEAIG